MDSSDDRVAWDKVKELRSTLREIIEPDYDLLDKLLGTNVLLQEEAEVIRSERAVLLRNDKLISFLFESKHAIFSAMLTALTDSDQLHVVNFIQYNGG